MIKAAFETPGSRSPIIARGIIRALQKIWPDLPDDCLRVYPDPEAEENFIIDPQENITENAANVLSHVIIGWTTEDDKAHRKGRAADSRFDRFERYVLEHPNGNGTLFEEDCLINHRLITEIETKMLESLRRVFPNIDIPDDTVSIGGREGNTVILDVSGRTPAITECLGKVLGVLPSETLLPGLHEFVVGEGNGSRTLFDDYLDMAKKGLPIPANTSIDALTATNEDVLDEIRETLARMAGNVRNGSASSVMYVNAKEIERKGISISFDQCDDLHLFLSLHSVLNERGFSIGMVDKESHYMEIDTHDSGKSPASALAIMLRGKNAFLADWKTTYTTLRKIDETPGTGGPIF